MHYCIYGKSFEYLEHAALCEHNQANGDLLARAENSGCEGCYVEVARWSFKRNRWERYCFIKILKGDDPERPDWPNEKVAEHYAAEINAAAEWRVPLIHNLPDRPNTESALETSTTATT